MIRCSLKNSLSLTLLISLLTFALAACTKMDKTMGESFIPEGQQLQVALFDATDFCSLRTMKLDSVSTANFTAPPLGIYEDARLGRTVAGFVTAFTPLVDYGYVFGDTLVFDSVYLQLAFSSSYGLDKTDMEVEVYELTAALTDSAFYGVEKYDTTPKLIDNMIGAKLSVGTTWVNADSAVAYVKLSDDLLPKLRNVSDADTFRANFKGLYVTVKDDGTGGCMKTVDIVNTASATTAAPSALIAFYHNVNADTAALMSTYHVFSYGENSPRFSYIRHQYKAMEQSNDVLYMQGLNGVATELQLNQAAIENWVNGRNIIVNRAELILPVEDSSSYAWIDNLYATAMTSIQKLASGGGYSLTFDAGSSPISLDGGLNRAQMRYSISITNSFNSAMIEKNNTPTILVPSGFMSSAASIFVSNKPNRKPQLKLWYSEIK